MANSILRDDLSRRLTISLYIDPLTTHISHVKRFLIPITLVVFPLSAEEPPPTSVRFKKIQLLNNYISEAAPDAFDRFLDFAMASAKEKPDYVIQLGDFCHPEKNAEKLMDSWNTIPFPKYHVLGNHDMDKGTKADIQKFWGMKKRYYDFDHNGWKFIVVDMNNLKKGDQYTPYAKANFYVNGSMRSWPDPEQLQWLDQTLGKTNLPVLIYTHQPFDQPDKPQHNAILDVIKKHQTDGKHPKVRAVICGHLHRDRHRQINGTHHICINSASYLWKDGKPWAYADALFTFMEIKNGNLTLTGKKTTYKEKPNEEKEDPAISKRSLTLS